MLITALKDGIKKRVESKAWWQDLFIELVSDIIMLILALIFGYYLKVYIM